MNPKSLINATRATIAKTRKIIQASKARRERSQKLSYFTDPKVAERLYHLLFGPPRRHS
jgi:hypothetical protein